MPQLGRFTHTAANTGTGLPVSGASVTIYREGSTVNGAQSGTSPMAVTVRHIGKIKDSDSVFVNTTTGTTYTAAVTESTGVTITLSGFAGTLDLADGDRLVPSNNKPTLYGDDQAGATTPNPLTTSSDGLAQCFMAPGAIDYVVSGGGLTAKLFQGMVVPTEGLGAVVYADAFASNSTTAGIQEAINSIQATGGKVILGAKTYNITTAITLSIGATGGVTIEGQGMDNTSINAGSNAIKIFDFTGTSQYTRIRDLSVRSAGDVATGVYFEAVSHGRVYIDNVRIDGCAFGITAAAASGGTACDLTLRSCDIRYGTNGIYVNSGIDGAWTLRMYDVMIRDNSGYGFRNDIMGRGCQVYGGYIGNNVDEQIILEGAHSPQFFGTFIERGEGLAATTHLVSVKANAATTETCRNVTFNGCFFSGNSLADYAVKLGDGGAGLVTAGISFYSCMFNDLVIAATLTDPTTLPTGPSNIGATGAAASIINCSCTGGTPNRAFFDAANGGNRWHLQMGDHVGGGQQANTAAESGIWFFKNAAGTERLEIFCRTVASTVQLFRSNLLSESNDRFRILSSGIQYFGDGTAAPMPWGIISATQSIALAADTITLTPVNNHDIVKSITNVTAGSITLTSNPSISNGSYFGQLLHLFMVTGSTNDVVITDGNNVQLVGANITLTPGDSVTFIWDSNDWLQHTAVCALA